MIPRISRRILGARYELSLSYIGPSAMRVLNCRYRTKDEPTDILAFPLGKNSGEIIICRSIAAKRAKAFGLSARDYFAYLVIHGCLHLRGLEHGRTMERLEDRWCRTFRLPLPKR